MAITYPHTSFTLYDNTSITEIDDRSISQPNYLIAFSSDKGPENITRCTLENFHKRYGENISFNKHGQPLLQAAVAIDNGGIVYCKRLVADDATLANIVVYGNITKGEAVQKTNEAGKKIYKHIETGNEVTEDQKEALTQEAQDNNQTAPTFEAVNIFPVTLFYTVESLENVKTLNDITTTFASFTEAEDTTKYPLFVISDIGRGFSGKSISITPDYETSRNRGYMRYKLNTIENQKIVESINVCLNHYVSENAVNRSLYTACRYDSFNLRAEVLYDIYDKFIAKIATLTNNTQYYCNSNDLLYGKTNAGKTTLKNITVNSDLGVNLSDILGVKLNQGTNGNFTDAPFGTEKYNEKVTAFFSGEIDDEIYDLDNYKFDLILDANYPDAAKRAIEALCEFRGDCQALIDGGITGLNTLDEITVSYESVTRSKYVGYYPIYYDVIDPYSGKQITVTSNYSMAKLLIPHFANNARYKPIAGSLNGFDITEAVEGTRNFVPKCIPSQNQKEILAENRINHLGEYDHVLCFETLWTTQTEYTQLSWINNMLAIEEVIKAVRSFCPANRFSIMYGNDLAKYKNDVEDIINQYKNNFQSIKMVYLEDPDLLANKIYGASISVACKEFSNAEDFKIYVV